LIVASPWLVVAALAYAGKSSIAEKYDSLRSNATGIELVDAQGVSIGLRPQKGRAEADMIVLPSSTVPDTYFRIFRALEDPDRRSPLRNWFGVDFQSVAVAAACKLQEWTSGTDVDCRGASTLEMQAARGWRGDFGGKSGESIRTQLSYMRDAASLSLLYERDSQAYRKFIVDALTYGTAPYGREVHGLRLASLTTFGVEPENLTMAQSGIIAAMPLRRIIWSCEPGFRPNRDQRLAMEQIKIRAKAGINRAFPGTPAAARALAEIDQMTLPLRPAPLPPALTRGLSERDACLASGNPLFRARVLAGSELAHLSSELATLRLEAGATPSRISLTTTLAEQRPYQETLIAGLREVHVGQAQNRFVSLAPGRIEADILGVRVRRGRITGLYSSAERPILDEKVRTGSIGKLVILVAAAHQGRDPDAPLCQLVDRRTGLIEVNGFRGYASCSAAAMIPIARAFGESLNLPILHLGRSLDQRGLRSVAQAAGMTLPPNGDLSYALVTGMSEASPRTMLAFEAALSNFASNRPAYAEVPYLVENLQLAGRTLRPVRQHLDLHPFLQTGQARVLIQIAGGAALREPRGTLRGLGSAVPVAPLELAKSGTIAGARPALATIRKLAVGASGEATWLAMISARRGAVGNRKFGMIPFATRVRSAAVAP
jgi:hypothetical protein